MVFHRGDFVQKGRGVGGIFSSIYRNTYPAVKTISKSILTSPVTKKVLQAAKKSVTKAGLNIASDVLMGKKLSSSARVNLTAAKRQFADSLQQAAHVSAPKRVRRKATVVARKPARGGKKGSDIFGEVFDSDTE